MDSSPLPTAVRALHAARLDIPLLAPFGISGGAQESAANVLVSVELACGIRGYGEAAPFPAYNGETQAGALGGLEAARDWVPGSDAADWRVIGAEFGRRTAGLCGAARCALETALIDAVARRDGVPLWRFFGGAGTALETDMTVTTGTVSEAAAAAGDIRRRGIRTIKVKIGGGKGVAADLDRISAILEAAPGSPLILDGNAGLSREQAAELSRGLRGRGVTPAVIEQWLAKDDLEGLRALGEETGWAVAADESVASAEDARRVARARAARIVNIKLMKAGVAEALAIAAVAREAGIGLMIGGNVESILAMSMSACFAAGLGGFAHADLDTPLFMADNPFVGGYAMDGGRISVAAIAAGHGVEPKPARGPARDAPA